MLFGCLGLLYRSLIIAKNWHIYQEKHCCSRILKISDWISLRKSFSQVVRRNVRMYSLQPIRFQIHPYSKIFIHAFTLWSFKLIGDVYSRFYKITVRYISLSLKLCIAYTAPSRALRIEWGIEWMRYYYQLLSACICIRNICSIIIIE